MDWATGLGLVMGVLATADLAYKYGSAILKKFNGSHVQDKLTHLLKKSGSRILDEPGLKKVFTTTTSKKMLKSWSRPSLENGEFISGSYARSTKIRPGYDLDIAVYNPQKVIHSCTSCAFRPVC